MTRVAALVGRGVAEKSSSHWVFLSSQRNPSLYDDSHLALLIARARVAGG